MEFEKKLKRLEEIVSKMEDGELALDKSLEMFEEGIKLSRECQTQLTSADKKIQKLLKVDADGKASTEDFQAES
jgi:exodeoxyribonuclease VII small subunit